MFSDDTASRPKVAQCGYMPFAIVWVVFDFTVRTPTVVGVEHIVPVGQKRLPPDSVAESAITASARTIDRVENSARVDHARLPPHGDTSGGFVPLGLIGIVHDLLTPGVS